MAPKSNMNSKVIALIGVIVMSFLGGQYAYSQGIGRAIAGGLGYEHDSAGFYNIRMIMYYPCIKDRSSETTKKVILSNRRINDTVTLTLQDSGLFNQLCPDSIAICSGPERNVFSFYRFAARVNLDDSKWNDSSRFTILHNDQVILDTFNKPDNCGITNYYFYNYLDRSLGENTNLGGLNPDPMMNASLNIGNYYTYDRTDPDPNDSIRFTQRAWRSNANFPYCTKNFSVYDPGGLGIINPYANPPIGLYAGADDGLMAFTPVHKDETVAWEYLMSDYRYDSSGNPKMVGQTVFKTITRVGYTYNNNPKIYGPYHYSVCEGENLTFTVRTTDDSSMFGVKDTLDLFWNNTIKDASFSLADSSARIKSGRFSWTPKIGTARSQPYYFKVTAHDDYCPTTGKTSFPFSITVKPRARGRIEVDSLSCNNYALNMVDSSGAYRQVLWTLLDSAGNSSPYAVFKSSNTPYSRQTTDTVNIRKDGVFIIKGELNNSANCSKIFYDTLKVDSAFSVAIKKPYDPLCAYSDTVFAEIGTDYPGASFNMMWNHGSTDSLPYHVLRIYNGTPTQKTSLNLTVTDKRGCTISVDEEISFFNFRKLDTLERLDLVCAPTSHILRTSLDSATDHFAWNTGDSTEEISVRDGGIFHVFVRRDTGCFYSDSIVLDPVPMPKIQINDGDTLCDYDTIFVDISEGGRYSGIWWNTFSVNNYTFPNRSSTYWVDVTATSKCVFSDSVYGIKQYLPVKNILLADSSAICDGDSLELQSLQSGVIGVSVTWNTGDTTPNIFINKPGPYKYYATNGNCTVSDSTYVVNYTTPSADIPDTVFVCPDYPSIIYTPDNPGLDVEYFWNSMVKGGSFPVDTGNIVWLEATTGSTCTATDTAIIHHYPLIANGFAQNIDTVCNNSTLVLDPHIVNSQVGIFWNENSLQAKTISVDTSGIFTVRVNAYNGCVFQDTIQVEYEIAPTNVYLGEDRVLCDYSSLILKVAPEHDMSSFLWSDGSHNKTLNADTTGWYWVDVTNDGGCTTRDSIHVIKKSPLPRLDLQTITVCYGDSAKLELPGVDSVIWTFEESPTKYGPLIYVSRADSGNASYLIIDTTYGLKCQLAANFFVDYKGASRVMGKLLDNELVFYKEDTVQLIRIIDDQPKVIATTVTDRFGDYKFDLGCQDSLAVRGLSTDRRFKGYADRTPDINKAHFVSLEAGDIEVLQIINQKLPDPGEGYIQGTVKDSVTNNSVDGLEVILVNDATFRPVAMDTTSDGVFRFANIPYGKYTVYVDKWRFVNDHRYTVAINSALKGYDTLRYILSPDHLHLLNVLSTGPEISSANVRLFPNPNDGSFTLNSDRILQKIEIVTLDGRLVRSEQIHSSEATINIPEVKEGVYILIWQNDDGSMGHNRLIIVK